MSTPTCLEATDEQKSIDGYRLMVSTRLPDPCSQHGFRRRDARNALGTGRRDGLSDQALAVLEADVAARSRELVNRQVARRLQPLFDKGGTLTVLGIGLTPGGLRVASAVARRRERPPRRLSLLGGLR